MSSFFTRRRLSKSDRDRNSHPPISNPQMPQSPPNAYNATMLANGVTGSHHDSRPASSTAMSDASYDFAAHQPHQSPHTGAGPNPVNPTNTSHRYANTPPSNNSPAATHSSRPVSHTIPTSGGGLGNLSRTDQVVLRYFWEAKAEENAARDLHFLKFPIFGTNPGMRELVPFCEIYALVKASQGAKVVGLGTLGGNPGGMGSQGHAGGGTFIGFELFANSQLHIDMDDNWDGISHYRVAFKPYEALARDHAAETAVRSWPKPLTIEFLEEQYAHWREDLTAVCWDAREVSELGGAGAAGAAGAAGGAGGGGLQAGQGTLGHGDGGDGEEGMDEEGL